MSETPTDDGSLSYGDGFCNGYGLALCQLRSQLERGVSWRRALAQVREHWLSGLSAWADDGDGEFPSALEYPNKPRGNIAK